MSELTISANEITEALRRHVSEYNPTVGAEQIEVGDDTSVLTVPSFERLELFRR